MQYEYGNDTITAIATPAGEGAIGIIRLSGPGSFSIVDGIFEGAVLAEQQPYTIHFGKIMDEDGSLLDEVLVSLFRGPKSYTGEDVIEISCHGSPYILEKVLALIVTNGARLAKPGEFTFRAFMNGKMDLSQAEAVCDLITSQSKSAHDMAIKQMRGGFSKRIELLREELIHFTGMIELELDFSEEDVEFADREELKELVRKTLRHIRELKESFRLGNALKHGIRTVIAGRPNAGKSTLLNALLNEERAIVSEVAGTTRDTIEEVLNIGGIHFRLTDTAGIREAADKIEAMGVERTMKEVERSAVVIYVFDVIETKPEEVWQDLEKIGAPRESTLVVANKMDLNPYTKPEDYLKEGLLVRKHLITLSAINRMNVPHLMDMLYETGLRGKDLGEDAVVSSARHYGALKKAEENLEAVLTGIEQGIPGDLLAADIRHALYALGEITGEVTTEDVLDHIFSNFCIGK